MNNASVSNYPGQRYGTQGINSYNNSPTGLWQYSQPLAVNWEYQELPQSHHLGENLRNLNEAGAAGWELCHVGHQHYLMKRKAYRQVTRPTP